MLFWVNFVFITVVPVSEKRIYTTYKVESIMVLTWMFPYEYLRKYLSLHKNGHIRHIVYLSCV